MYLPTILNSLLPPIMIDRIIYTQTRTLCFPKKNGEKWTKFSLENSCFISNFAFRFNRIYFKYFDNVIMYRYSTNKILIKSPNSHHSIEMFSMQIATQKKKWWNVLLGKRNICRGFCEFPRKKTRTIKNKDNNRRLTSVCEPLFVSVWNDNLGIIDVPKDKTDLYFPKTRKKNMKTTTNMNFISPHSLSFSPPPHSYDSMSLKPSQITI